MAWDLPDSIWNVLQLICVLELCSNQHVAYPDLVLHNISQITAKPEVPGSAFQINFL